MADEEQATVVPEEVVTQEEQEDTGERPAVHLATIPSHLKAQWFDEGVAVPDFMNHPNWLNMNGTLNEPVYVRLSDGTVEPTYSPLHLAHWILDNHGVIVAAPKEGD